MTENMPPTLRKYQQLHRSLTEKILYRAEGDPAWKQQLIDDPEAAMRTANFPELQQLEQTQGGEVWGQHHKWGHEHGGGGGHCPWSCVLWTLNWQYSW
jgi:hypothetical protein